MRVGTLKTHTRADSFQTLSDMISYLSNGLDGKTSSEEPDLGQEMFEEGRQASNDAVPKDSETVKEGSSLQECSNILDSIDEDRFRKPNKGCFFNTF